ncbi:MAG: ribosome silencing factor [Desulfovibrio sp.]|jgi:ribosome-associated protein|nr:ribosome silencing factor [Desulfovibrio sp.]
MNKYGNNATDVGALTQDAAETLRIEEKLARIKARLEERKAERVTCINLSGKNFFVEGLVTLTAGSARHARSLADDMAQLCHEQGWGYLHREGYELGQWILLDLIDTVINIFLESSRELYRLESLWGFPEN